MATTPSQPATATPTGAVTIAATGTGGSVIPVAPDRAGTDWGRVAVWCLLVVGSIIMVLPILWMISTSLKLPAQIFKFPPEWIPNPWVWQNYPDSMTAMPFARYVGNTLFITGMNMIGVVLSSSFAAYAFARLRFPGRDIIFWVLMSTMMLPQAVILIPRYIEFRYLNWIDTWLPLIVPNFFAAGLGGAFFIFLLRQFFRTIPRELSDAAKVDGASEFRIYWQIVMPLTKPALTVVLIFTFIDNWNNFLEPLIILSSPDNFTVALGLATFRGLYATQWHLLMAASTIMVVPVVILFFVMQRYFVQGVVLSGLKG